MILFGHHGVHEDEQKNGQNFEISVICKLVESDRGDSIGETVDYSSVMDTVSYVFHEKRYSLIETLAEAICMGVLDYKKISKVTVSVKKPDAPIDHDFESVEVVCTKKK